MTAVRLEIPDVHVVTEPDVRQAEKGSIVKLAESVSNGQTNLNRPSQP